MKNNIKFKKNTIYKYLEKSAEKALLFQKNDGSMPSGHNGPYFHPETPVRNTVHWLIILIKVYKITKNKVFLDASRKCINYLVRQKTEYNYHQRTYKGKDKCNGLIGPAWVMEALIIASKELNRMDLSDLASEIFFLHKLDKKNGLWHRREIDGKILSIDWTFNHQLWFAAIASTFNKKKYPKIHNQVKKFIKRLDKNFNVYNNGLIKHSILLINFSLSGLKNFLLKIKNNTISKKKIIHKTIGYHQFNLYAFGILKENYPNISFWKSEKFKKALKFIESKEYEKDLENNKFGFDYNVAGIEIAYVLKVFKKNSEKLQKYWLEKQFQRNYDFEKNLLCRNAKDPETLSARIYEIARLDNLELDLKNEEHY
jgi:hypothetical protein